MQTPWADLVRVRGQEAKPDLRGATRHQRTTRFLTELPVKQLSPKGRDRGRVGHLERHRFKLQHHVCTVDPGLLGQPLGSGPSPVCESKPGQRHERTLVAEAHTRHRVQP